MTWGAVGGSAENATCAPGDTHSFAQPLRRELFHPDFKKISGEAHVGVCLASYRSLLRHDGKIVAPELAIY